MAAQGFRQERQTWFRNFIHPRGNDDGYSKSIEEMLNQGKNRLVINLNDVREKSPEEYRHLLDKPMDTLPAYEAALKSYIDNNSHLDPKIGTFDKYHISIEGAFGSQRVAPRELKSGHLTRMMNVEGIVIKTSLVRPKVVKTVHYCEATERFQEQSYRDGTDFTGQGPTKITYPTEDTEGNRLETEFGLCEYRNHQKIYIQDMPERTVAGTMPRTIEVIVENDLVDACKPGDRVQMIGVYRAMGNRATGKVSAMFKTVLIVNNVRRIGIDERKRDITAEDNKNIKQLRKRKDIFELLSRSVAPCIYGHEYMKKAVTLMLLGGVEKNLENGTHIRGDINVLMVGDPSTAKSQLLRAVKNTAPLVVMTTGRGSSGVGLTAAVTRDKDSDERRLEAGAMVLADRGVVCIDEFDKMSDVDRTAIHEVMEQQTVTIAKAGIQCSLNARCSVIAASNPVYGQYDRTIPPAKNIALPDSLLSRFDLLFIVLDKLDPRIDRAISDHVMRMHRMLHATEDPMLGMDEDDDEDEAHQTQVFEKADKFGIASKLRRGERPVQYLTADMVKKYIRFAKSRANNNPPRLTDAARESISQKYAQLRQEDRTQTLPITARCIESMIRMACAHAKLRFDNKVTDKDVEAVYKVLQYALTNDATPADEAEGNKPGRVISNADNLDEEMAGADEEDEKGPVIAPGRSQRSKRKKPDSHASPDQMKVQRSLANSHPSRAAAMDEDEVDEKEPIKVDRTVFKNVAKLVNQYFRSKRVQMVTKEDFYKLMQTDARFKTIMPQEFDAILKELDEKERIFLQGDEIHKI